MNETVNLHLPQFAETDRIHHDDFNDAFQAIDAAVAAAGNCKIAIGSYVGDGQYGADHPNTLTFAFEPRLVILDCEAAAAFNTTPVHYILKYPAASMGYSINDPGTAGWSGHTVRWYNNNAVKQLNESGKVYHYIAIGV